MGADDIVDLVIILGGAYLVLSGKGQEILNTILSGAGINLDLGLGGGGGGSPVGTFLGQTPHGVKVIYNVDANGPAPFYMGVGNWQSRIAKWNGTYSGSGINTQIKVKEAAVRMNVFASPGASKITSNQAQLAKTGAMFSGKGWKNFEMTAYVKTNVAGADDNFTWYGRGGHHTDSDPCEGSSYKGGLYWKNGLAYINKEQWHSGGYADAKTGSSIGSLMGKWIGIKFVVYNKGSSVVIEVYADPGPNDTAPANKWQKLLSFTDTGSNWGKDGGKCGGTAAQAITWSGGINTWRWDGASDVDFRWASILEIVP